MLDNLEGAPTFIDIDMYGSEIDVLKGAQNTLTSYRPELLITLHEDRIMKERERIIGMLALMYELPIDVRDEEGKLHIWIIDDDSDKAKSYFRGRQFQYYRKRGPEPIMYFTGWTSEVIMREKLLRPDEVVYDVGAHIGGWTIPAALISKHVYAFEPNIDCCNILHDNLCINSLDNVSIYNVALSHTSGIDGKVSSCFTDNNVTLTARLDDFESVCGGAPPDFIKIDVEGAELAVLQGARETIVKHKPRLFIETHILDGEFKDGFIVGGHNTYQEVIDYVTGIVPDYIIDLNTESTCIFTPP